MHSYPADNTYNKYSTASFATVLLLWVKKLQIVYKGNTFFHKYFFHKRIVYFFYIISIYYKYGILLAIREAYKTKYLHRIKENPS